MRELIKKIKKNGHVSLESTYPKDQNIGFLTSTTIKNKKEKWKKVSLDFVYYRKKKKNWP